MVSQSEMFRTFFMARSPRSFGRRRYLSTLPNQTDRGWLYLTAFGMAVGMGAACYKESCDLERRRLEPYVPKPKNRFDEWPYGR